MLQFYLIIYLFITVSQSSGMMEVDRSHQVLTLTKSLVLGHVYLHVLISHGSLCR